MPGSEGACGEVLCEREVPRRRPALLSGRRIWPARLRHWPARSRRRQNRCRIAENGVFSRADEQPTHRKARRAFYLTPQVLQDLASSSCQRPKPNQTTGPTHSRTEPTAPDPRVASRPVNRRHAGQPHDRTHSKAAGYVTSFGPSLVHVSGSVPRPAPAAPPAPTSTPRRRRVSTYSAQRRRRTSTALPARALFIYPGRFSSPQTAPAPWPYNSRYRECPRPRSSGGCTGVDAFPYNLRLYGIKSALPGRQHERGIPLSNSPHCRGPAPHTPRQRFAAAPRPAPGAGPVDTLRQHPQDQLANIVTLA